MSSVAVTSKTHSEIAQWMTQYLSGELNINRDTVRIDTRFEEYGLDSASAVRMMGDLEDFIGEELSPSLPYRYPSIAMLSSALASGTHH